MAKVQIKQIRGLVDRPKDQKLTIKALGLGRINKVVEKEATPQILGMIKKVNHLIEVTNL
ncbi:MAG TPA: 50S ribosomal protein L30 [Cytophagales bacterium]|nr:50S ribosomal protein L30 [Cytophagales bacterium]